MKKLTTSSKKIRKGDTVIALTGNNKGYVGTVQSLKGDKVIVQGLNVRKRHVKKTQQNPQGGIIEIEEPIHISNLAICPDGKTAQKLKVKTNDQNERQLVYQSSGQEIIYRSVKKPK